MKRNMASAHFFVLGTSGPELDIVSARIYIAGVLNLVIPCASRSAFSGTVITNTTGKKVLMEHSFVDASGKESPRFQQYVTIQRH